MSLAALPSPQPRHAASLTLCVAGSLAAHGLLLTLLPGWVARRDVPPPLTVELLKQEPPQIVPPELPRPLPMETRAERAPPELAKPAVRQPQAAQPAQAPILTAPSLPPDAPPAPGAAVVPEQRPALPPESPRPPVAVVVTPPRSDAAYLNNPRPAYPLAARRRGDQGTVLVRVLVTAEGLAVSVGLEKSSGHPALDEAALAAVKTWRFIPARQGAQAIESPYVVPIVFKVE